MMIVAGITGAIWPQASVSQRKVVKAKAKVKEKERGHRARRNVMTISTIA